ncbi:amino acid ABC transporter permease [uncultured Mitsuokella sp.]|uniref:amino acid ABC transporter permease n=1 Tax=uncultured Mitsuokella sp. TaxID=453120 RepID=UPI00262EA5FB|nr:amino acid ABC transporter permease [uncultured Mitsuokella sp.]
MKVTLFLTLTSVFLGAVLGLISCLAQKSRVPVLGRLFALYVYVCRSIPNMVFLYLVYYGLPLAFLALRGKTGIHIPMEHVPAMAVAVIGLTLHTGAYLSEIFRAALDSVPDGQFEAARAMGMTEWQMYRRVIFPQAVVFALPLFANQFLSTMKSTSIVFVITVIEVFGAAKLFCEDNSQYFEAYIVAACLYWGLGILFEYLFTKLEDSLSSYKRCKI